MKSKTTIIIETLRQTRIHRTDGQQSLIVAFCEFCQKDTTMLVPEEAARLCNRTTREVYRGIERGAFHFLETNGGALFVCGESLENQIGDNL